MNQYYLKRQALIINNQPIPNTLIENFVSAKDPQSGKKLSKDDILSEAMAMLLAGTDTTSNSLSIFFYLLMKHPKIMDRTQTEVRSLGIAQDKVISYERCKNSLPYLEAAIKESMRLLPAVPGRPFREVPEEGTTILGYNLPGGVSLCSYLKNKINYSNIVIFL